MPAKVDKFTVGKKYDKRIKLTSEQRKEIKELHTQGGTYRGLARAFNVDRGTIRRIIDTEYHERQVQLYKERKPWLDVSKKERRDYMRKHRAYKKELFDSGLIGEETNER